MSWRGILLVNVPIGVLAIVMASRLLACDDIRRAEHRLGLAGAVLATAGLAACTLGIAPTRTRNLGDTAVLAALVAGLVVLIAFVTVEARFAREPLMPMRLFNVRAISVGNVAVVLAGACFMPSWYFFALYMHDVMHYEALHIGLGFLPYTLLTILVGAKVAPWLMQHVAGRTLISVGALIAGLGFLWQSSVPVGSNYVAGLLGPMLVVSVGGGLLNTPITTTVTAGIAASDAGAASGLMNTTKQVGGAVGLAALVALAGDHAGATEQVASGYDRAFFAIAVLVAVVAAVALGLPAGRDHTASHPHASGEAPARTD